MRSGFDLSPGSSNTFRESAEKDVPRINGSPQLMRMASRIARWVSQGLTIVLICSLPWWFGGVQPRAQLVCAVAILAVTILTAVAEFISGSTLGPRLMTFILFAAILLGGLQMVPLPQPFLARIAPENASLWQSLTTSKSTELKTQQGLELGVWGERNAWPISLFPASSWNDWSLLCVGVAVFVFGASQFVSDQSIRTLVISVSVCGAAFGFFGIVQRLTWNGKIYGVVPLSHGGDPFAAFVNRNNAGGFLNLTLAACLGMLAWSFRHLRRHGVRQQSLTREAPGRSPSSTTSRPARLSLRDLIAQVTAMQVFAVFISVVVLAAVLSSFSRGAMLSCVLALAVVAIASSWLTRKSWLNQSWLNFAAWTLLAVGGIGLTAWVGWSGEILNRAGTVADVVSHPDGRWEHWRDCLSAASRFWPTGSGLGTQRYVYRLFEATPTNAWFYHAENQYIEALVDGGWIGLGLLVAALVVTVVACCQLLKGDSNTMDRVVGIVGLFAITSQAIHACFDFGLYLPANMCLFAVICGVVHGRNVRRHWISLPDASTRWRWLNPAIPLQGSMWGFSIATVLSGLLLLSVFTLNASAQAEAAVGSLPAKSTLPLEIGRDTNEIRAWEVAALANPNDAETRLRAARAWIDRYRHTTWETLVRERPDTDPIALWNLTLPAEVHTKVRALEQSNRDVELEDFRSSRIVRDNLVPALRHLFAARSACPLLPEVHLLLSELAPAVSDVSGSAEELERVRICAPRRAQLLAEAGLLAMVDSKPDVAASLWQQAVTTEPERFPTLLRIAASQPIMRPHLRQVLPPDVPLLVTAARESFAQPVDQDLRNLITQHAKEMLPSAPIDEAQRWHLEGLLLMLDNQPESAIDKLTKASRTDPMKVAWRFDLAIALADSGMTEQARDHASFCTRMEPDNADYAALLKRLIRRSLTSP